MEWHAVGTQPAYKTSLVEEYWVFLYKYFAISLIKLFLCLCLTMMLTADVVLRTIKMFVIFIVFIWAEAWVICFPLLSYSLPLNFFSPIDVFLFFDDLGSFDCIYAYKPSLVMYSLHRWIIELTMSTAITTKQQKRNRTHTIDIHFNTSTWKSLVNLWWASSTHVKTRRIEAKIFLASFSEHRRKLPCDRLHMSRIDLVSKNLLANFFRNCRKKYNWQKIMAESHLQISKKSQK